MRVTKRFPGIIIYIILFSMITKAYAHCEIPCGIYDDSLRVALIEEHIGTVEKSMKTIIDLSKEKNINYNQLVRWIDNKEAHAEKIQMIVSQYFMNQRIKPATTEEKKEYERYVKELTLLHQILIYSMKCKQTTDIAHITKLRELTAEFKKSYFSK